MVEVHVSIGQPESDGQLSPAARRMALLTAVANGAGHLIGTSLFPTSTGGSITIGGVAL